MTAEDSSPDMIESSTSSEDEANAELAEARHEAAQARVRLLEARVRERLASRTSRSNASSASETSRPPTPHEPVLPVAAPATPPRSTWRRGRLLQGMMPHPSPVPEIPLASRPRDPALCALRRSEEREFQTEMAHVRAECEFLNARCAELDARESRIEMLYRTVHRSAPSPENSTAFGTLEAPEAPEAPQASEAMMAPPSLVLHLMDNDQDRDFRTPDGQTSDVPNHGSLTPAVEMILAPTVSPRPTYRADPQIARGIDDPDPDPSEPASSDDGAGRRNPINLNAERRDGKREITPYKVKSTELKLGGWPTTIQFAAWRRALRASVAGASDRPELATAWIFEVERPDVTFDSFRPDPSDRLRTLDAKLAEALGRVVKGETSRRVAIAAEKAALAGSLRTGRQILFMVYQEYRRDDSKTDHVAYANLEKLGSVSVDTALDAFMSTWEALLLTFKVQPSEAHLYSAFYARMCKVPGLSTTIAHIDRQQFGHEDKSYDFLYAAATRLVQQRREERQANELAKLFTQPGTQQGVALAAVADKKTLPCFKFRDGAKCEARNSCPYSHDRQVIETAKKAKQGKGKGGGKGK